MGKFGRFGRFGWFGRFGRFGGYHAENAENAENDRRATLGDLEFLGECGRLSGACAISQPLPCPAKRVSACSVVGRGGGMRRDSPRTPITKAHIAGRQDRENARGVPLVPSVPIVPNNPAASPPLAWRGAQSAAGRRSSRATPDRNRARRALQVGRQNAPNWHVRSAKLAQTAAQAGVRHRHGRPSTVATAVPPPSPRPSLNRRHGRDDGIPQLDAENPPT